MLALRLIVECVRLPVGDSHPRLQPQGTQMQKLRLSQLARAFACSIFALSLLSGCGSGAESEEAEGLGTQREALSMSMLGADISAMQRTLDLGYKYYDSNGVNKDPHDLLKAAGANYVRFRVWNATPSNYNN